MRIQCKFCIKNRDGFCSAKSGAKVEPTKKRKCTKYVEDVELKSLLDSEHEENVRKAPLYKPTYRYYQELNGEKVDPGPMYVKVN